MMMMSVDARSLYDLIRRPPELTYGRRRRTGTVLWSLSCDVSVPNRIVGRQSEGSLTLTLTTTSINVEEPQPHDSQNQIIEPSDYQYIIPNSWDLACVGTIVVYGREQSFPVHYIGLYYNNNSRNIHHQKNPNPNR